MMNVRENMGDYFFEKSQAGFMENVYIVHWNSGEIWEMCIHIYIYIYTSNMWLYVYTYRNYGEILIS